ncbi:MAG TPA: ferric reductase-like transmembrane domain-containing protein, partial [Rugosimonospora sp.]|nr:ferric reductase-like transmembrane domain-containing protein [Rugosimonospora sp.]
ERKGGKPVRRQRAARPAPKVGGGEQPVSRPGLARSVAVVGFWALLAASVGLWVLDTPPDSLAGPADLITAAGRIAGLAGGYALIVEVLMISRLGVLERRIGARDLMRWHRFLGVALVIAIPAHIALIITGYAMNNGASVGAQAWTILTTFQDVIPAAAAAGVMVAVAALAIRAVRRRLRYEIWHLLHLAGYLVLLLAYGHQFALGTDLQSPLARSYWLGLYVVTVGCLLWGRLAAPAILNVRHRLRVAEVVPESADTVSIYLAGRYLPRLQAQPGQYLRWRFLTRYGWWQSHPFSLSRAPNRHELRLTVHAAGDHTRKLSSRLRPGTRVLAEGPFGTFTAARRTCERALLIAGGSGIAPIRALLDRLPGGSVLIYRAKGPEQLVFREELDRLAGQRGVCVHYVLGPRSEPAVRQVFTPTGLTQLVPDVDRRDVYLCGPPGMVESAVATLRRLRVPPRQIHLDPFEF